MKTKKETAPPSARSALRRSLGNILFLTLAVFLLIETQGVPCVRLSQHYRQAGSYRIFEHNRYWSPFGTREVRSDTYHGGLPFLVLLKPEPSLADRLRSVLNPQP